MYGTMHEVWALYFLRNQWGGGGELVLAQFVVSCCVLIDVLLGAVYILILSCVDQSENRC